MAPVPVAMFWQSMADLTPYFQLEELPWLQYPHDLPMLHAWTPEMGLPVAVMTLPAWLFFVVV